MPLLVTLKTAWSSLEISTIGMEMLDNLFKRDDATLGLN